MSSYRESGEPGAPMSLLCSQSDPSSHQVPKCTPGGKSWGHFHPRSLGSLCLPPFPSLPKWITCVQYSPFHLLSLPPARHPAFPTSFKGYSHSCRLPMARKFPGNYSPCYLPDEQKLFPLQSFPCLKKCQDLRPAPAASRGTSAFIPSASGTALS